MHVVGVEVAKVGIGLFLVLIGAVAAFFGRLVVRWRKNGADEPLTLIAVTFFAALLFALIGLVGIGLGLAR